jgi:hypothetical protein
MTKNFEDANKDGILPNGKPIYRLLTGVDDRSFCEKVSKALVEGYELYGSPSIAFNGKENVVLQAVVWGGISSKPLDK